MSLMALDDTPISLSEAFDKVMVIVTVLPSVTYTPGLTE